MDADARSLAGMPALVRFLLRLDRVRIVVWLAAVVLLVASTVASVKGLYPNQEELDRAAAASQDNAAAIIFNGPPLRLATVGGQVAFQTGTWGLIVVGMMNLFLLGRMTRGEEEAGRTELVRSLPVGRHAWPAAALLVVAAMDVLAGVATALSCAGLGLPVAGSVAFGLSFTCFGLLLAAITIAAALVVETARAAYAIGGIVLGASFIVRGIGDVGSGTLSWLSPIGWAQKTRPFAGETWWPLLLLLATAAGIGWLAGSLVRRRDLGAGLVRPRAGRAEAPRSLGAPLGLAVRLQRGTLIGWSIGLLVLGVAYGAITSSIDDFVADNPELADIIAAGGQGTIVEQYLAMSFRSLSMIAGGFAIQSVLRIRGEETSSRAEQVLATPVSRLRFAASHVTVAVTGSALLAAVVGLVFGVAAAATTGDAGAVGRSVLGMLVFVPAVAVLIGVSAAVVGAAPGASALPWVALAVCFVVGMFGQLFDLPSWVADVSPFQHVPRYPATGIDLVPLAVLVLVAVGLTAIGAVGLRRRDLGRA